MGYTHTFSYQPGGGEYAAAWPLIVADTRRILRETRRRGVITRGPDGSGQPLLDPANGIAFNGDATSRPDLSLEACVLAAPGPVAAGAPADCRVWRFVKTEALPYDLAVTAVLLRCHLLAPATFAIGGSGEWAEDWTQPPNDNPRDLIHHLFGTYIDDDPLVDPSEGMAIGPTGWTDPRLLENPVIP